MKTITALLQLLILGMVFITAYFSIIQLSFASGKNSFEPWDEQVFVAVEERHGVPAANRLRKVQQFIIDNQHKPVAEKLEFVNDFMNALPWIADPELWKRNDYWATPFETLTTFGGDCEDIAIAKYVMLRLMNIPDDKLSFAYVQTSETERHMVLVYKETQNVPGLILDNQHPDVATATKRRDLLSIYVFKNDGTLYLIDDDGKNERKLKTKLEDRKFAKWASAKERSRINRKLYEKYNGGRPLFPE